MDKERKKIDTEMLDEIMNTIAQVKYGEVVVTIYNSKIVQIEKKEKKRFS